MQNPLLFSFPVEPFKKETLSFPQYILVVDDDARLRDLLFKYLQEQGFVVSQAQSAQEALIFMEHLEVDLVVLDIMMPGQNGFEFCEQVRKRNNFVPILFLSARGDVQDRLEGFERGGDDYLPKPFEPKELLFRIQAILRRKKGQKSEQNRKDKKIYFGDFSLDLENFQLMKEENPIALTEVERRIMALLFSTPGVVHTRESLAQEVSLAASPRSIDVQIVRLRRKLEKDPKFPRYLQTVRHKGYVFIP